MILKEAEELVLNSIHKISKLPKAHILSLSDSAGAVDSMMAIEIIFDIEEKVKSQFGLRINLTSSEVLSQAESPFKSTENLIKTIFNLVNKKTQNKSTILSKLIIVDLDDTLWKGTLVEDGLNSLEANEWLQRTLVELKNKGILLAIVSKNSEYEALEALRCHRRAIVKPEDFVSIKINWQDKAENIIEIAKELNLSLDTMVFIDSDPVERFRVSEALPQVLVPDMTIGFNSVIFQELLLGLSPNEITLENKKRTALYNQDKVRQKLKVKLSVDEWINALEIVYYWEPLKKDTLARTVELMNRSNQMNLRTRRLTSDELRTWANNPNHNLITLRIKDRFGDYGIVGLIGYVEENDSLFVEDFVLSCRAMGRKIEYKMLAYIKAKLKKVIMECIPNEKNKPCQDFIKRIDASDISY